MSSNSTTPSNCPSLLKGPAPAIVPLFGNVTFHKLAYIVGGACAIFATVVSLSLMARHATHFSRPEEQKHFIRIISLVIWFAVIGWLSIYFEAQAKYLTPLLTFGESIVFASFFLYMCALLSPDPVERDRILEDWEVRDKKGNLVRDKKGNPKKGGLLKIFNIRWICVFQFPQIAAIILVLTEVTQASGAYCVTSNSPDNVHIWIEVINAISTGLAITAGVRHERSIHKLIAAHKPLQKLVAFKLIVGVQWLQTIIFTALLSGGYIKPTKYLSLGDLAAGLPSFILDIEMVFFSLGFLYAFRVSSFKISPQGKPLNSEDPPAYTSQNVQYYGGKFGWRAFLAAARMSDILAAMWHGPMLLINKILRRQGNHTFSMGPLRKSQHFPNRANTFGQHVQPGPDNFNLRYIPLGEPLPHQG